MIALLFLLGSVIGNAQTGLRSLDSHSKIHSRPAGHLKCAAIESNLKLRTVGSAQKSYRSAKGTHLGYGGLFGDLSSTITQKYEGSANLAAAISSFSSMGGQPLYLVLKMLLI